MSKELSASDTMWLLEKIREGMENLPFWFSESLEVHERISAQSSLSRKLPSNVLTPDKIPDFFIPPRLSRRLANNAGCNLTKHKPESLERGLQVRNLRHVQAESYRLGDGAVTPQPNQHNTEVESACHGDKAPKGQTAGKPLDGRTFLKQPLHSREYYGLTGLYESPNTRRKESLFHSRPPSYSLGLYQSPSRLQLISNCKVLPEQGSIETDTPSSNDSSPHDSPGLTRSLSGSMLFKLLEQDSHLGLSPLSTSKQNLRVDEALPAFSPGETPGCPPHLGIYLCPPVLYPLDMLHCQERLQREHVLPLLGRGRVRLSAERSSPGATLRVRVVSVEDLHDDTHDGRLVHCFVSLCLTPGKHQRQNSATIRNCRNPIFNEDFFFTELTDDCFHSLYLRLKVLDKASSLKRDTVLGVISKPLSQLLPL
nr:C2 calcium-dependent domain-containing protein 4C-like [Paramormyrops kingsleyae]